MFNTFKIFAVCAMAASLFLSGNLAADDCFRCVADHAATIHQQSSDLSGLLKEGFRSADQYRKMKFATTQIRVNTSRLNRRAVRRPERFDWDEFVGRLDDHVCKLERYVADAKYRCTGLECVAEVDALVCAIRQNTHQIQVLLGIEHAHPVSLMTLPAITAPADMAPILGPHEAAPPLELLKPDYGQPQLLDPSILGEPQPINPTVPSDIRPTTEPQLNGPLLNGPQSVPQSVGSAMQSVLNAEPNPTRSSRSPLPPISGPIQPENTNRSRSPQLLDRVPTSNSGK